MSSVKTTPREGARPSPRSFSEDCVFYQPRGLLKHEGQTYKVFFKALEEANLAIKSELREQIERRAYEIWLADGSRHGDDLSHWFRAEIEALEERA
jgi:hypothetical protein